MTLVAVIVVLLFVYSLVSRRLERTIITAPILFTGAGMLAHFFFSEARDVEAGRQALPHVAEFGLVLLLFTDASRTDLGLLKDIRSLPTRLLGIGMLATIVLGAVCARLVFHDLSWWEAGILSAILAPTDAGLGQIIVNSPRVPMRIRQALNVEAGLNDGLSVPFLLFFIALAAGGTQGEGASLMKFIVEQLGYGALVGIGIGLAGGWLLGLAHRTKSMAESWQHLGTVALPVLCLLASQAVGASMFIAAFVAGLAVQHGFKEAAKHSLEFAEGWGQLLNLSVFFFFGMIAMSIRSEFEPAHILYAVLSLTIVRILPVALALAGTRLSRATVLFMGWFGPRGLASIVLGLVYLEEETHLPGESVVKVAVVATVLMSVLAHGVSAVPGMSVYARRIAALGPGAPENESV